MKHPSAIVIGAGIVGLAVTRALVLRGFTVTVFERNERQSGASVRNFGMIWPVGQPAGELYERAMLSRSIWKQLCDEAGIWYSEKGSLHAAYHSDELQVMEEFAGTRAQCRILNAAETLKASAAINPDELMGSLWSPDEMIVEARDAIRKVADFLAEKYGVTFFYNTAINQVHYPEVQAGNKKWRADRIYVCSGPDFETLYPEVFSAAAITKVKLQMLRIGRQPENIGPSLCGGLSLIHYASFKIAPSLNALKERYEKEYAEYLKWGIHVMLSQNGAHELTVGDSHEYGLSHDPFDKMFINKMILQYLDTFARLKNNDIIQTWHGFYSKLTTGGTELIETPCEGVTIINALGGAGMTLSFGLAERYISNTLNESK